MLNRRSIILPAADAELAANVWIFEREPDQERDRRRDGVGMSIADALFPTADGAGRHLERLRELVLSQAEPFARGLKLLRGHGESRAF
jgi:hypothetical protein